MLLLHLPFQVVCTLRNLMLPAFGLLLLLLTGCDNKGIIPSDTPYFDSVLAQAEIEASKNNIQGINFLNAAYLAHGQPGTTDLYRRYQLLLDFYEEPITKIAYADSMIGVVQEHIGVPEYAALYATAMMKKADMLLYIKHNENAFACIYKGRLAMGKVFDSCQYANYTFMLARVSYKQEKYLDAARYMLSGLAEQHACPWTYHRFRETQAKLDDIGLAYAKVGMTDSALYYFDTALNLLQHYNDSFPQIADSKHFIEIASGVIYGNKGDIYRSRGDTATAEELYNKSVWLNGREGYDHGDAQCSQLKLTSIYLAQNRVKEADDMLVRVRASLDSFGSRMWDLKWHRLRMEYLHKTGRTGEIYSLMVPYMALHDSLARAERIPATDVIKEYERLSSITELQKKNEVKSYFLIATAFLSVLALVIAVLLWYWWKQTRRLNSRITRQNEDLNSAMDVLAESQKENTRMMQIVAHDLKNPIASMTSIIELLQENTNLSDDERTMLTLMKETNQNATELISNLLYVGEPGQLKRDTVNLAQLLRQCIDLLQFRADEKQQKILLDTPDISLMLNRAKIWRVMSNVMVNAIKFSPEGCEITVTAEKRTTDVLISVKDKGMGIPEHMQPYIFEMFSQARRLGTMGESSTGMGLAISRRIVLRHGGNIWFESQEGSGTVFYISLPLQ